jgi:hypothetical protein
MLACRKREKRARVIDREYSAIRKIAWRLLPFLVFLVLYLLAAIECSTVPFADLECNMATLVNELKTCDNINSLGTTCGGPFFGDSNHREPPEIQSGIGVSLSSARDSYLIATMRFDMCL